MADNIKPYNPNKGFISFRLNPEAIKEALIEQVPYNRTLRHIYNNPEGDIRETAKIAASETPILGSILMGEPTNAVKEALLFGTPAKAPLAKKQLSKFKPGTEIKVTDPTGILVKEPNARKAKVYSLDEDLGLEFNYAEPLSERWNKPKFQQRQSYTVNDIDRAIKETNDAYTHLPVLEQQHPVEMANRDIGEPLSYGAGLNNFNASHSIPIYRDRYNGLGQRIEAVDYMNELQNKAANAKLRQGEKVGILMPGGDLRIFNSNETKFRAPGSSTYNNIISGQSYQKLPPRGITDLDVRQLKEDIEMRNQRVDFGTGPYDEYVVPYRSMEQYYNDYKDAYNAYKDAINGPFIEDVIPGLTRQEIY